MDSILKIAKKARAFRDAHGIPTTEGLIIPLAAYPEFKRRMKKQRKKLHKKIRKFMKHFNELRV